MPPGGGGALAAESFSRGDVVDGKWIIDKLLGKGGFGAVFEVKNRTTGEREAMKIEMNCNEFRTLKVEFAVLTALNANRARHVCQIKGASKKPTFCYIVMSLVGPSINSLLESLKDRFPDGTTRFVLRSCIFIAKLSLEALEDLHKNGFLHRDVKPHNYASGRPPNFREIYLLDFGMCRKYLMDDGTHRPPREVVHFRGTEFYASVNCLRSKEQSRRDDIWSWMFMLIRITVGRLPWYRWVPPRASFKERARKFADYKEKYINNTSRFVEGCPNEYKRLAEIIKVMGYFDNPPYNELQNVLNALMERKGYGEAYPLDWEVRGRHHTETRAAPVHNMMPQSRPPSPSASA